MGRQLPQKTLSAEMSLGHREGGERAWGGWQSLITDLVRGNMWFVQDWVKN